MDMRTIARLWAKGTSCNINYVDAAGGDRYMTGATITDFGDGFIYVQNSSDFAVDESHSAKGAILTMDRVQMISLTSTSGFYS
jgi:hypothetical protein